MGVIFEEKLSFKIHMHEKINKAYGMLGLIKRNFRNLNQKTFILLYKSLARPQLDYSNSAWSPYEIGDIEKLEKFRKGPQNF